MLAMTRRGWTARRVWHSACTPCDNSYAISPPQNARNPSPAKALSRHRASCLPQFDVKTLGLGRSGVFFHWSNRMVAKAIRHGAAVGESAFISTAARQDQDNDGVVETSIP